MNAVQTNKLSQTVVPGPQKQGGSGTLQWNIMGDTTDTTMANKHSY